jgi:hypothetical protein
MLEFKVECDQSHVDIVNIFDILVLNGEDNFGVKSMILKYWKSDQFKVVKKIDTNDIIGFYAADSSEIFLMYVLKKYRKMGYGKQIVCEILEDFNETVLIKAVREAIPFWCKCGFIIANEMEPQFNTLKYMVYNKPCNVDENSSSELNHANFTLTNCGKDWSLKEMYSIMIKSKQIKGLKSIKPLCVSGGCFDIETDTDTFSIRSDREYPWITNTENWEESLPKHDDFLKLLETKCCIYNSKNMISFRISGEVNVTVLPFIHALIACFQSEGYHLLSTCGFSINYDDSVVVTDREHIYYNRWTFKPDESKSYHPILHAFGSELILSYLSKLPKEYQIISVGSGDGYIEALFTEKYNIDIICVDPDLDLFGGIKTYQYPEYKTVPDLLLQSSEYINNCSLLIHWPDPNDSDYDYEAILLLNPKHIILTYDIHGGAGGEKLHEWLKTNEYRIVSKISSHEGYHTCLFWQVEILWLSNDSSFTDIISFPAVINMRKDCKRAILRDIILPCELITT